MTATATARHDSAHPVTPAGWALFGAMGVIWGVPYLFITVAVEHLAPPVAAFALGDLGALRPGRVGGIALGLGGVALLVGGDLAGDVAWWTVVEVLVVCVGYATAPFIASRRLAHVPDLGVVALSLSMVAVAYAPAAWLARPDRSPSSGAWAAVLALGVVCTALAFVVFFRLIARVGPARATLITFVNPAVAIVVGAVVLDEAVTSWTLAGFALVLAGCWLATRHRPEVVTDAPTVLEPG